MKSSIGDGMKLMDQKWKTFELDINPKIKTNWKKWLKKKNRI